jgi:hypothetical protein
MNQLEILAQEFQSLAMSSVGGTDGVATCTICGRGDPRLPELLEKLITETRRTQVVIHSHADTDAHLEAKDRLLEQAEQDKEQQEHLRNQFHETQIHSRRLAAKVRESSSDHSGLKQRLDKVKRSARKQDELLAAYEKSHQELSDRLQSVAAHLDEERRSRRDQEAVSKRLAMELHEARQQLFQASDGQTHAAMYAPMAKEDENNSTTSTLRLEHERLRIEEREQRRRLRTGQPASAPPQHGPPKLPQRPPRTQQDLTTGSCWNSLEAARVLARALSEAEEAKAAELAAEQTEQILREERHACQRELEVSRLELRLEVEAQDERSEELCYSRVVDAERRARTLAEVANEVAHQADLRQLQSLHDEVQMQNAMGAVELRCSVLAAVVNQAAAAAAANNTTAATPACTE